MAPNISQDWEAQLRALREGWDTYDGAKPITEEAIRSAKLFFVVPCRNGGIQIETHQSGLDIEIGIRPSGEIENILISPVVAKEGLPNV